MGQFQSDKAREPCVPVNRREIILYPKSGVFQNIAPPPPRRPPSVPSPAFGAGGGHTRWVERGGGSIFWTTPDTALYITDVSTLYSEPTSSSQALIKILNFSWYNYTLMA